MATFSLDWIGEWAGGAEVELPIRHVRAACIPRSACGSRLDITPGRLKVEL